MTNTIFETNHHSTIPSKNSKWNSSHYFQIKVCWLFTDTTARRERSQCHLVEMDSTTSRPICLYLVWKIMPLTFIWMARPYAQGTRMKMILLGQDRQLVMPLSMSQKVSVVLLACTIEQNSLVIYQLNPKAGNYECRRTEQGILIHI